MATRLRGVDEQTGQGDSRTVDASAETWRGDLLVRITVETGPLPQDARHLYVTAAQAVALGESLIRLGRGAETEERAAVLAERETCARAAEAEGERCPAGWGGGPADVAASIAAAIRARK